MPVDVFVDAQGRVRRMALQLHLGLSGLGALVGGSGQAGSSGGTPAIDMTMTLDLYDFGTPVDVQAPPAGQVVSIGSLGSLTPSSSGVPASPSAVSSAV